MSTDLQSPLSTSAGSSDPASSCNPAANPDRPAAADFAIPSNNVVVVTGEMTEIGQSRQLAGGIDVVRWTLRVPRGPERAGSDLIDCVALDDVLQTAALMWPVGQVLSVQGAIRRRFFRAGGRITTRVEIEAEDVAVYVPLATSVGVEQPDQ